MSDKSMERRDALRATARAAMQEFEDSARSDWFPDLPDEEEGPPYVFLAAVMALAEKDGWDFEAALQHARTFYRATWTTDPPATA